MGKYWVLLWWARPCSVKLLSYCLLMGGVVLPLVVWPELTQSWSLQAGRAIDDLQEDLYLDCLLGLLLPVPMSLWCVTADPHLCRGLSNTRR